MREYLLSYCLDLGSGCLMCWKTFKLDMGHVNNHLEEILSNHNLKTTRHPSGCSLGKQVSQLVSSCHIDLIS